MSKKEFTPHVHKDLVSSLYAIGEATVELAADAQRLGDKLGAELKGARTSVGRKQLALEYALSATEVKGMFQAAALKAYGLEAVPAPGDKHHEEYTKYVKDRFANRGFKALTRALAQHAKLWLKWNAKEECFLVVDATEKQIADSTPGAKAPKAEGAKADGDKVPLIDVVVSNIMHLERTEENWNRVIEALETRWESDPDAIKNS